MENVCSKVQTPFRGPEVVNCNIISIFYSFLEISCFTGTTYGNDISLSYRDQALTNRSQVLLEVKILDHSQRWKRTKDTDDGYFYLKSCDDKGCDSGKALTLGTDGSIKVEDFDETEKGKF